MTILVTGAGGYVASHFVKAIKQLKPGVEVRGLVRKEADMEKARRRGFEPVLGDVSDMASLEAVMQGVETVVHLAAINRERGASTFEAINHMGGANVVQAAKKTGVKHIMNMVGLGADASSDSAFQATQGKGLDAIRNGGVPYTLFTASVIFGEGDEFVNTLAGLARMPLVMVVPGDGQTRFEPVYVGDMCMAMAKAVDDPSTYNQEYYICGPEVLTLEDIIDATMRVMGIKRLKVRVPAFVLRGPVWLMTRTLKRPFVTLGLLELLGEDNVYDPCDTRGKFGIEPVGLEEGIAYVRQMTLGRMLRRSFTGKEFR